MASTLADSVRRRLEDELKKTLLKACDDSDKSDPKTSGFAALADLKRLDLTGEAAVWKALFDPTVLDQARNRLIQHQRRDLAKS
jgi:hypothetical protein